MTGTETKQPHSCDSCALTCLRKVKDASTWLEIYSSVVKTQKQWAQKPVPELAQILHNAAHLFVKGGRRLPIHFRKLHHVECDVHLLHIAHIDFVGGLVRLHKTKLVADGFSESECAVVQREVSGLILTEFLKERKRRQGCVGHVRQGVRTPRCRPHS